MANSPIDTSPCIPKTRARIARELGYSPLRIGSGECTEAMHFTPFVHPERPGTGGEGCHQPVAMHGAVLATYDWHEGTRLCTISPIGG